MNTRTDDPHPDDDHYRRLEKIVRQKAEKRKEAAGSYRDASRERLRTIVTTKIRTTMIGAIAQAEAKFGHTWGLGKPRHLLTEREREMDSLREELRTAVLNLGNAQIRAVESELKQYSVTWERYHYDLCEGGTGSVYPAVYGLNDDGTPKTRKDD